jgi:hypothetical protein
MLVLTFVVDDGPTCMLLISGKLLGVNVLFYAIYNYRNMDSD